MSSGFMPLGTSTQENVLLFWRPAASPALSPNPRSIEADDAANGAARILCDDGAHDLQSGGGLRGVDDEGSAEAPVAKIDGNARFRRKGHALSTERAEIGGAFAFFKEDVAGILGEGLVNTRRIFTGPATDALHGKLVAFQMAFADEPGADRVVLAAVLVGKAHAHEGAVGESDAARA